METTFLCGHCRLLQPPATSCCECDSPVMVAMEFAGGLLKTREPNQAEVPTSKKIVRGVAANVAFWGGYAGVVAASMLWWPAIPIIIGTGVAGGTTFALLRRSPVVPVAALEPRVGEAAVTKVGIARRLAEVETSVLDDSAILAEEVTIKKRKRGVLFRRLRAVPFLVELDGGDKLVVTGVVRVATSPKTAKLVRRDPRLLRLGILPSTELPREQRYLDMVQGTLEVAAVREGDRVTVAGELTEEVVPELAFHRDAGEARVMRGRTNAVVVIT